MIPSIELKSGFRMPQVGYGTWQVSQGPVFQQAYEAGYRHFDTATMYGNERVLGQALGTHARQELFVTSKLLPDSEMGAGAISACERMLARLQMDYLDLLLIHWPGRDRKLRQETWRSMEQLVAAGKVRPLGLATSWHLRDISGRSPHLCKPSGLSPALPGRSFATVRAKPS